MITAVLALLAAVASAQPTRPLFPTTFIAEESVVLQQTGEPERTGRVKSYWEQNFTGGVNRTAYYTEGSNSWTVWEYSGEDDGTAYVVQDGRCAYYCTQTNLQCNLEDSLCSYDYLHSAKFAGSFDGLNCFAWADNLGPIPMNYQSICINGSTPVPVSGTRDICPFGKHEGWENTTYISFQAVQPPASAWNIPDKEYCNPGNDDVCQGFDAIVRTWGPGRAASMMLAL